MADTSLLGDLLVKIRGDLSDLEKSINSAEGQSTQASKKIESDFSKSFQKIATDAQKIGKSLSTFVTLPILGAAAAAVKLGSDTGESLNAANVVFKNSSKVIEEWGKVSAKQAGLTAAEFYQASAVIGAGLTNAGASSKQAADQTIELTKRAADMASIFNTDVNDALVALQAGLRGESEPLRRYAISLDEATIKARAMEMGLVDANGEVTAYGKSQARLAIIMEQSTKFQGDFVNTSDQLANGTRVTTALVKEQVAEFGKQLLPIVLDLVQGVGKFADMLSKLSDNERENILLVAGFAAATGPAIMGVTALTKAVLALNAGLVINPIVAATVAVVALGAATAVIINNFKEARKEKEELDKALNKGGTGDYAKDLELVNKQLYEYIENKKELERMGASPGASEELDKEIERLQKIRSDLADKLKWQALNIRSQEEMNKLSNGEKITKEEILKLIVEGKINQQRINEYISKQLITEQEVNKALQERKDIIDNTYKDQYKTVLSILDSEKSEYEKIEDQIESIGKAWQKGGYETDRLKAIEVLRARQAKLLEQEKADNRARVEDAANTEALMEAERNKAHGAYIQMQIDKRAADKETQEEFASLNKTTIENAIDEINRKRDAFIDAGVSEVEANEWAQKEILKKQLNTIDSVINGISNLVSKLSNLYQMDYKNRIDRIDAKLKADLKANDKALQDALKKAGVADLTAEESARKQLTTLKEKLLKATSEEEKASLKEQVIENEKAVKKAEIEEAYQAKQKGIEKQAALNKYNLEKKAFYATQETQLAQATIAAATGAVQAYMALAGIPIVGPGLGIAAAAAMLAYGEEQKRLIRKQVPPQPPSFSEGGWGNKPTVAQVFDNPSYPEFVAPLSPEFFDNLANGIMNAMSARSSTSSGYSQGAAPMLSRNNNTPILLHNTLVLDGKMIGENTVNYLDNGKIRSKVLSKAVAR